MNTLHKLHIVATCPEDDTTDIYWAEIECGGRLLPVAAIHDAIEEATEEPIYQEQLTKRLAALLGVTVRTRGTHSGIRTECEARQ